LALVALAFDRAPLAGLAERSRQLRLALWGKAHTAIEQTRQLIVGRERQHICVVAPIAALDPASLLYDHLVAALSFLRRARPVALYLTGPLAAPNPALLERFGHELRVYADPALIDVLGERVPRCWSPVGLDELFENRGYERAYFMADCRHDLRGNACLLQRAYVRVDAIALAQGDADGLVEFLRTTVPLVLLSTDRRSIGKWAGHYGIADSENFTSLEPARTEAAAAGLLVLGAADDPLLPALETCAARAGATVNRLDPRDAELATALVYPGAGGFDPRGLIAGARLAVDLGTPGSLAAVMREAVRRLGIPLVTPLAGPEAATRAGTPAELSPASLLRLLRVVHLLLSDGVYAAEQSALTRRQALAETKDAGWYWLWQDLTAAPGAAGGWEEMLGVR